MEAAIFRLPLRARRHVLFAIHHRRLARLREPRTFNEKLNWRILNDRRPLIAMSCDKLAAKEYAAERGLRTPATLWSGEDVADLAGLVFPERWVLKPNHRSGDVYLGSGSPDVAALRRVVADWQSWARETDKGEWGYTRARPLLLVEELLGGAEPPADYKVHVFGGEPRFIQVDEGRFAVRTQRHYLPDWSPAGFTRTYPLAAARARPAELPALLEASARVGAEFDFIRADFYLVAGEVIFGELTAYPGGGLVPFTPRAADRILGDWWQLPGR